MTESIFKGMKPGVRHYENASCKVAICTAIPNSMRAKTREIVSIDVPENLRRQGMATQMILNICDEADAHKMVLLLFPKPFGDGPKLTVDGLIKWYSEKFGFQVIQAKPIMMARMPFATPGPFKPNYVADLIDRNQK